MNDAITAYQNALQVVTKDSAEMDWAIAQNNLGIALSTLGERQSGEDAIARLKEAVTAYQKALEVYTKDNASINWAKAQVNMALVYNLRAAVFGGEKAKADLEQALFHVDAALGVFDPVHSPYNHDTATTLRERILSALNAQKG
jgi:tetratricopeptide (TPR) repeat protein